MKKITFSAVPLIIVLLLLPARLAAQYAPPASSSAALSNIDFRTASPLNEAYRAEFANCDRSNVFKGVPMRGFRRCSTDPNRVKALLKFQEGTIFFESKMGLDIDGSWKACHDPGLADLCSTWLTWDNLPVPGRYVDSDVFPYVVIPISGTGGRNDTEFRDLSGIKKGDIGVVVYKNKIVPVLVADGGPHNKLGEGSAALFKALGEDRCRNWRNDGHCLNYRDYSISEGVMFFLFPNSAIPGLTPANALARIQTDALARFERLKEN